MNRREAMLAGIAALVGEPVVAVAAKPKEMVIEGGCRPGKSVRGPWEFDTCGLSYVAILDEFTTAATGLNHAWMAEVEIYVAIQAGSTTPVWLAEIPPRVHRNRLAIENGWIVNSGKSIWPKALCPTVRNRLVNRREA